MDAPETRKATRRSSPEEPLDAAIVGAGPYGLSVAAQLRGRGLRVAVFGKTMELWREHMPRGMLLRSPWMATDLSDPDKRHRFADYFRETGQEPGYPEPLDTFVDYALWFQRRTVPQVDETYVRSVRRDNGGFVLTLEDGRRVAAETVVMAVGIRHFAHRPPAFAQAPADLVSHTCDVREPGRFRGREVVVVGGGQSAVEYAALLHEAGARVHVVSRRPIVWLEPHRPEARSLIERIRAPATGLGPGWKNWTLVHVPFLFHHLPASLRERLLVPYSGAWASEWLWDRVAGKVTFHEGRHVASLDPRNGRVDVSLSDGTRIVADHVILATGYRVDVNRLAMLDPELRAAIATEKGFPVLGPSFETSVPGLYFVGITSMRAFGPIYRFVLGCRAAAPRVARSVGRRHHRLSKSRALPNPETAPAARLGRGADDDP